MTWFVSCGVLSLFIDEGGELEYRAEVVKHECRTIDPIPYGGKPVPTARLNAAAADLAIFSHGTGWRGALGHFSKELHGPILDDQSAAKVVALYGDPSEDYPEGTILLNVFLPRPRFELLGTLIEKAMNSGNIQMSMNFDFNGFRDTPADWNKLPFATETQFFGQNYPYVTSKVRFFFGTIETK